MPCEANASWFTQIFTLLISFSKRLQMSITLQAAEQDGSLQSTIEPGFLISYNG